MMLTDGRILEEEVGHAKGSDKDPLTEAEVVDKYRRLVTPLTGGAWADEVHEIVMSLEDASSINRLTELLADVASE
jgi:2-methylcitrate dehydratase PrpD